MYLTITSQPEPVSVQPCHIFPPFNSDCGTHVIKSEYCDCQRNRNVLHLTVHFF